MRILIDADACPVVRITEQVAGEKGIPVTLLCDTNHVLQSDYSEVITVGAGADAVDFKLVSICRKGDLVVTQDYGLAAMCLARNSKPVNQNGMRYHDGNIDGLLASRHTAQKIRRGGGRTKGPTKRTREQDEAFIRQLRNMIVAGLAEEDKVQTANKQQNEGGNEQ